MTRSQMRAMGLALAGALGLAFGTAAADYPERPITLIVPWGAGSGTDASGRMIASLLQEELGQPVNVVNRTGDGGVVGHAAIAGAAPDGYTIGTITAEIGVMHWAGLTDLTGADFTPIALYNSDPAGLQVRASSLWDTAQDVLSAVKVAPGEHKGSGSGQASIWRLALAGMLEKADIAVDAAPWIPSKGAAPGLRELAAGDVDIVTCSVAEAASLIEAGKVRSLAVMESERLAAYPDVPTLQEATGVDWQLSAWRGLAGPKGMPDDVAATLTSAFEKVWRSDPFQDFMKDRGYGTVWKPGGEFAVWMEERDQMLGQVMQATGLAK